MAEICGVRLVARTSQETAEIGACLGQGLVPGDVVALTGELGSGKTCLVKGLSRGLGVSEASNVRSPSFVILNIYPGRHPLYHFDLYRIAHPAEFEDLGYREIFYGEGVTVIEWAEKILPLLPEERVEIQLSFLGDSGRGLEIEVKGARFRDRWPAWQERLGPFV